mmetsp:Transcript_47532/g.116512  ORF Transcript_47532/g.116512 Transcript_47532/m.116512 type:complete len:1007 (-) Transcript_47532:78-3098(-)
MRIYLCLSTLCAGVVLTRSRASSGMDAGAGMDMAFESSMESFNRMVRQHSNSNLDPDMAIEDAVTHLSRRTVPHELKVAMVGLDLRGSPVAELVGGANRTRQLRPDDGAVAAVSDGTLSSGPPEINDVMKRIFKIINGMIIEDQNKLVLKTFECLKQGKSYSNQYRTNRMNFYDESYKLQEAVSTEKHGQVEQSEANARLRHLNPVRKETETNCNREVKELQAEFDRISYDFTLARKIADGTSCAKKTGGSSFLQSCMRMVQDKKRDGFIQFHEDSHQHELVSLLQTEKAKRAFQRGLVEAAGPHALLAPPILLQTRTRLSRSDEVGSEEAMEAQEDELAHRANDFRDYFFDDVKFDKETAIVDGVYQQSAADMDLSKQIAEARVFIQRKTSEEMRDYRDEDAPPNAWIPQKDLDAAARELSLLSREDPTSKEGGLTAGGPPLPAQEQGMPKDKEAAKFFCTVSKNPNCPRFRDKLEQIVGELQAEKTHTEHLLETTKAECKATLAELDSQISEMDEKQNEGARIESEASAVKSDATGAITAIEGEGRKILREWDAIHQDCIKTIKQLRNNVCGTKKLKQEVITIEAKQRGGKRLEINDCSVSEFTPGECLNREFATAMAAKGMYDPSQFAEGGLAPNMKHDCGLGGGTQYYTRQPVSPPKTPDYGADCPPLRLKTSCNDFECPVQCQLGDWEGWSACSKSCDGGMKRRVRPIDVYPQYGGEECDPTKQEETCDALACDRPCTLNDWTPWRACTRACERGIRWRSRTIKKPATGAGRCARTFSKARYHKEYCNDIPCPAEVVCVAKLDLLVGLDASGSMTSDGWKAQSAAMLDLLEKTKLDAKNGLQIGIAKFAWDITLVHHLTDDKKALTKAVTAMTYDGWTTNLGGLFRTMKNMLQFGRRDAPSICMAWTDGRPSYPSDVYDTASGAHELRPVCRVMVVTMRPAVPREMVVPWVSHPKNENVYSVDDPLEMTKKVNDITTFYCAKIMRLDAYLMGQTTTEAPKE